MNFVQIFLEEQGKPSLKRILGFILVANGLIGKNILAIFAIFRKINHYTDIDNTFDGLIYGGIALIFGSIADKFFRKKL